MHSSFARALNDIKNGDGSLAKALNSSQSLNINAPPLLLSNNAISQSFNKPQAPKKKYQPGGFENSFVSQNFNRKMKAFEGDGDRFIPSRRGTDMERAQFYLAPSTGVSDPSILPKPSDRILKFTHKRPTIADQEPILGKVNKSIQSKRYIPSRPENVLDAPNLLDDFYLSILDWSDNDALAIALDREVYIWKASTGEVQHLMTAGLEEEHITSVRFSNLDGNIIAIGTSMGRLQLWDVQSGMLQRTMLTTENDPSRIPALAWREHIITSGSRTGEIRHHDIRIAQHQIGYSNTHTQEVCGLQWSLDNRFLASGGNDNLVCIYNANEAFRLSGVEPVHELTDHTAAVKALAWCPWKPNLLASGGGTRDHHLRFWNVYSGACIRKVDVKTQVSGIIWNEEHRELISSHGNGSLCIWSYPSITKVKELVEHKSRVLAIASSPDKEVIASCGADETLRIWQCFQVDSAKKRLEASRSNSSVLAYSQPIR